MNTNKGLLVFNKAGMLRIFLLHAHVNKYLIATILSIIDVDDISLVRLIMYTAREK